MKLYQILFFLLCSPVYLRGLEYIRPYAPYYSQCGQDKYLNEKIFFNKKNGVLVDIGAHDGISFSNTYYFEKFLGWTGICIEPHPDRFLELKHNRKSICFQGCISNFNGKAEFMKVVGPPEMLSGLKDAYDQRHLDRINRELSSRGGSAEVIEVEVCTLQSILDQYGITKIDFLSVDTEGSELLILKSIDWAVTDIDVIIVENNYNDDQIYNYLVQNGYVLVENFGFDEIYRKRKK